MRQPICVILLFLCCWWSVPGCAAAETNPPEDLLFRVRSRVQQGINRLPKYLCTLTIDRTELRVPNSDLIEKCEPDAVPVVTGAAAGLKAASPRSRAVPSRSDRLRFDVTTLSGVERYSWVGENHFDDRQLTQIVPSGAISTGTYTAFLRGIFDTEDAVFSYVGPVTENKRALAEFDFTISEEKSHYRFTSGAERVMTGYHGTFLVDPVSADLVRLTIRTAQLPRATGACAAVTMLQYQQVQMHGAEFLLPAETGLRITNLDGSENVNHTTYSGCREFLGESTLHFDDAPPVSAPVTGPQPDAVADIPANRPFTLALLQKIDTRTAAAGDRITAKLVTPITEGKRVLVPQGTVVTGHILRIETRYARRAATMLQITIKLTSMDIDGVERPFRAWVKTTSAMRSSMTIGGLPQPRGAVLGTFGTMYQAGLFIMQVQNPRADLVVKQGLESEWTTLAK